MISEPCEHGDLFQTRCNVNEHVQKILKDLTGKDLSGFTIQKMTEVYMVNEDGRKTKSLGHFADPDLAKVFAGQQTDSNYTRTGDDYVLRLTGGTVALRIDTDEPIEIINNEQAMAEARKKLLDGFTPEQRKILGL